MSILNITHLMGEDARVQKWKELFNHFQFPVIEKIWVIKVFLSRNGTYSKGVLF